ncbi:MAG: gluconokinase [Cyclobacteriaceae bacterium]
MNQIDIGDKVVFVMGVSGSGKSVIGNQLAQELGLPFVDADDHHPEANIKKMAQGIPLNDNDRIPWLNRLNQLAKVKYTQGCVIACSALKEDYRLRLMYSIESRTIWIYLKGSYDQIFERMNKRVDHFMGANMLQSQFDTLEEPANAITISIADSPEIMIAKIREAIVSLG